MDYELTVGAVLRHVQALHGRKEIVSRRPDRTLERTTYADVCRRARALASALGLERGDRVATLCWNHAEHLEIYLGVPIAGAVVHTLNLRLHADDLAWIAAQAGDRLLIVDESLVPLAEQFVPRTAIERVIVVGDEYERLIASGDPDAPLP